MTKVHLLAYGDIGGSGGYLRYCRGIFGPGAVPEDFDVHFVCSPELADRLGPLDCRVNILTYPEISDSQRLKRYIWYLMGYPRLVRSLRPDLEYYPSGHLRVYGRAPLSLTACHNLLPFESVEMQASDPAENRMMSKYGKTQKRSFLRSSAVIFSSAHSQRVVTEALPGIKESTVILNGLGPEFLLPHPRSYDIGRSATLLYVSSIFPYKHHPEVIEGVARARRATGKDLKVRFIGDGSQREMDRLRHAIGQNAASDFVQVAHGLSHDALLAEHRNADLAVFASSCEAFGISLLEAMGFRLPIACSERSGLPDILGDAGVYFNPFHPESIAAALVALVKDARLRAESGEKAFKIACEYTWGKSAALTYAYARELVAQRQRKKD